MQEVGQIVYSQAGASGGPTPEEGPDEEPPEDTVEGEYREV